MMDRQRDTPYRARTSLGVVVFDGAGQSGTVYRSRQHRLTEGKALRAWILSQTAVQCAASERGRKKRGIRGGRLRDAPCMPV